MQRILSITFRWTRRVVLGLLAVILLLAVVITGLNTYDAIFGPKATDVTNISFSDSHGNSRRGYLAIPPKPGPHPAVLLIHEWWGLNEGITVLADALAREGYVVLAPDVYRNHATTLFTRAIWLRITIPTEQVKTDVDSALDHLLTLEEVDTERVASMGFCFGGGHSLQLGLRQSEKLSATIVYYGQVVTGLDELRPLKKAEPVLGIFGAEDQQILKQDVLEFEAALNSLDIENEITIYDGVGHAFVNEDNYNKPGPAMDAWQQTLAFLETNLKGGQEEAAK
jgi:carboxymethylenebutenolidase